MADVMNNTITGQGTNTVSSDGLLERLNKARIYTELRRVGISNWGLQKSEVQYLPQLLHANETIGGVVQGHSKDGGVMLVATDRRIMYIDTKPLFKKCEDISYEVVSGITLEWVALSGTLILHTRMGDEQIRTTNSRAAAKFKAYVEERSIERSHGQFVREHRYNRVAETAEKIKHKLIGDRL